MPKNGDCTIYLGNGGDKLVVHTHTVLLMRQFPHLGSGYHPVYESLMVR